mmetsp:Transcript_46353/g.82836  ORF Transcript_46353/g.82836 Transcript_46353/m.82836 type:complete len:227 (+) Transcript_46353:800-1480(+)
MSGMEAWVLGSSLGGKRASSKAGATSATDVEVCVKASGAAGDRLSSSTTEMGTVTPIDPSRFVNNPKSPSKWVIEVDKRHKPDTLPTDDILPTVIGRESGTSWDWNRLLWVSEGGASGMSTPTSWNISCSKLNWPFTLLMEDDRTCSPLMLLMGVIKGREWAREAGLDAGNPALTNMSFIRTKSPLIFRALFSRMPKPSTSDSCENWLTLRSGASGSNSRRSMQYT